MLFPWRVPIPEIYEKTYFIHRNPDNLQLQQR